MLDSDRGSSGSIMLNYCVTTTRRAYTRKSWIPFRSKFVMQVKSIEPRFRGGSGNTGTSYTNPAFSGMNLTTAAAVMTIF